MVLIESLMSQITTLIATLKRELKTRGITYAQVADHLELSENSVKRTFAEENFSLDRLEKICQFAGMELSDLTRKMVEQSHRTELLSEEQEREIAADVKLLMVAVCLLNQWTVDEILAFYTLSDAELIQLLAKLDRLQIIELLPLNRVRLTVAKSFRWRPNGPIQQFFQREVQTDFFQSSFDNPGETLIFHNGMLSRSANAAIVKKMERLAVDFNDLNAEDATLPLEERFGTSLVIAIRAWEFSLFKQFRRDPDSKLF